MLHILGQDVITKHRNIIFENLKPMDFAMLAYWIYDETQDLPSCVTLLATKEINEIKYAYFRFEDNSHKVNIFVIRGTNNFINVVNDYDIFVNGGTIRPHIHDGVECAYKEFEKEYGKCNIAVGHSLGGKLLEVVVHPQQCLGISFNPYHNNRGPNILAFRAAGDLAGLKISPTNYLISNEDMMQAHSIENMVKLLKDQKTQWRGKDVARLNSIIPQFDISERQSTRDLATSPIISLDRNYLEDHVNEIVDDVIEKASCRLM